MDNINLYYVTTGNLHRIPVLATTHDEAIKLVLKNCLPGSRLGFLTRVAKKGEKSGNNMMYRTENALKELGIKVQKGGQDE